MAEETRILILGQSNTRGVQLAEPVAAWPNLLAAALPAVLGGPVAITVRPFFAHVPGAVEYLERELKKQAPEIVFLMVTTFSFSSPVIEPGVRRRFGQRVGDAYHRLANRFDKLTRNRGAAAARVNRAARAAANRLLPAEPVSAYDIALSGTIEALRRLSREEDIQVMAIHGFVKFKPGRRGRRSPREREVRRFLQEVRLAADALRITFLNLLDSPEIDRDRWFMPDGLHVTAEAHQLIAAHVLEAFRTGPLHPVGQAGGAAR